jgi:hypothetical protein
MRLFLKLSHEIFAHPLIGSPITARFARNATGTRFQKSRVKPRACLGRYLEVWVRDGLLLILGGLITIAVAMVIEYLRRPKLTISIAKPDEFSQFSIAPTPGRSLKLIVRNEPLSWMLRSPVLQARGSIIFRCPDGRDFFGRTMEARWAGTPEPIPPQLIGPGDQIFQIVDFARFTSGTRIDIYPGEQEKLDVVARLEPDQECYGWNNETYFPPSVNGKNPNWRLPTGRYLVEATIRSSGQTKTASFQLINEGDLQNFRLEPLMEERRFSLGPMCFFCNPIAVFTAVLCLVGLLQAWAFIQSERAFVFPSHLEFVSPLAIAETQPILLSLDMRNSGRSTAQISKMIVAVTHQLPPTPNYDNAVDRSVVAFPPIPGNGQIAQELNFKDWNIETMRKVRDGSRAFYLFGGAEYTDDYSWFGTRVSRFCFVYIANKDDQSKSKFVNCTEPQYTNTK